ncbi:MAG TPA: hydantoinase/oxoprolinase family protein [Acidimicrobiales bacterium]|nr:hydantoinase/oxoprolinase family protein [Acidimicrobiales bacterium]
MAGALALGIDIGGTFTDIVIAGPEGVVSVVKQLTTPQQPADAAVTGAQTALAHAGIAAARITRVVHGTTLATNAILERRDVPVAYLTTRGFGSLLQLGRHARVEDERYDLAFESPAAPVEAALTFEVAERMSATGEVIEPLDEAAVMELAPRIRALGVRAVAVCLLHSYVNAQHEQRIGEILRDALGSEVEVVLSCDVWPEVREYERATTTVMSAFVGPIMSGYLTDLETRLHAIGVDAPLFVMESAGGVMSATMARRRAVSTIESGPAAGVIAAKVAAADHGYDNVIAFDMGGTTAKAGLVTAGEPDVTHQFQVGGKGSFGSRRSGTGIPIKAPTIDLAEVGAGGGSIAWVDEQGALHVGPRSAGSDPGPVCYGRGGAEPTVTDASVVLGYLDPQGFAAGSLPFDAAASRAAIAEQLARPLAISAERAAAAVHEIANATMAGAIHVVTVQRGVDPRRYVLVTSGGAGPLHAPRIAERFGITSIVVPPACGVASALGLLASDLRADRVRTVNLDDADISVAHIAERFDALEREAAADVAPTAGAAVEFRRSVDVRYRGQSHELNVVLTGDDVTPEVLAKMREDFYRAHREAFDVGTSGAIEVVNVRVRATQAVAHAIFSRPSSTGGARPEGATRDAWFAERGGFVATPVHQLGECRPGAPIVGPALLEAPESTVLVPPGWTAVVAPSGAVVMEKNL